MGLKRNVRREEQEVSDQWVRERKKDVCVRLAEEDEDLVCKQATMATKKNSCVELACVAFEECVLRQKAQTFWVLANENHKLRN